MIGSMRKRVVALFSGTVQGVGFRFTAERLARRYEVAGFVKNLPDGRVELVAEGEEAAVQDFFQAVRQSMGSYIRHVETQWSEAQGPFQDFNITF